MKYKFKKFIFNKNIPRSEEYIEYSREGIFYIKCISVKSPMHFLKT